MNLTFLVFPYFSPFNYKFVSIFNFTINIVFLQYHFLIEKLKKKDYDEFQERKSRFNTITRENFSPFGMVFSAIPGIIGVYLAELINFILDLKANNPGVPIGKITSYAMENIFSSEYPYLVYGVISCGLIIFSAGVLVYQNWKMKKN